MSLLPTDEKKVAKAWLHDVFVWGGLASTPKISPDNFWGFLLGGAI